MFAWFEAHHAIINTTLIIMCLAGMGSLAIMAIFDRD